MNDLREKIVRQYCRTAIWIDDQILDDQSIDYDNPSTMHDHFDFFVRIAREFQEKGISCSLKNFPEWNDEEDSYADDMDSILDECKRLTFCADIILIDWMLGHPDSPKYCIEILKHVINSEGNRFIIILSQADEAERIFSQEFPEFQSKSQRWKNDGSGIFISLQNKRDFRKNDTESEPQKLFDKILLLMTEVHEDYLHWIALEMAAKIKEIAPQWISSLPKHTDLGILAEVKHSRDTVCETIFENLMEDLRVAIKPESLESLGLSHFDEDAWKGRDDFSETIQKDRGKIPIDLISTIREVIPCCSELNVDDSHSLSSYLVQLKQELQDIPNSASLSESLRKIISKIIFIDDVDKNGKINRSNFGGQLSGNILKLKQEKIICKISSINRFVQEHRTFTQFCEIISVSSQSDLTLKRGSILIENKDIDILYPKSIWICVSQSCDCTWKEQLIFIQAKRVKNVSYQGSKSYVRFKEKLYEIEHKAKMLSILDIKGTFPNLRYVEEKKCVGYLRRDIINRLSKKLWEHLTRVGVNLPALERSYRPEEL